jgi:hypothetical protein
VDGQGTANLVCHDRNLQAWRGLDTFFSLMWYKQCFQQPRRLNRSPGTPCREG